MMHTPPVAYPQSFLDAEARARRIAKWSLAYIVTTIAIVGAAAGKSQAMKSVWFDDILGLIPPLSFLIGSHVAKRRATDEHPYGFMRAPMIGHLANAIALIGFGVLLVVDSSLTLAEATPPSLGAVVIFGHVIWSGWVMLAALAYSIVPMAIFGRLKERAAVPIHDRALYADAVMAKADWLSGGAAVLGILGVALGFWWADAVAGLVVALDILHDGVNQIRGAVSRIVGARPRTIQGDEVDALVAIVEHDLARLDWVASVRVRVREEGHVLFGEAAVVPRDNEDLAERMAAACWLIRDRHWRMHDLTITLQNC